MPSAEIDIKYMMGWNGGHRRHVGPVVRTAVEKIKIASDEYGFEPSVPKVVNVWQVSSTYPVAGEASNASTIDLHFPLRSVRNRKADRLLNLMTVFGFHEFVHCYRMERYTGEDILEFAATEGIAYCAQDMMGGDYCGEDEVFSTKDSIPAYTDEEVKKITAAFYGDLVRQRAVDISVDDNYEVHKRWFETPIPRCHLTLGETLGVHYAQRHLDKGVQLADLVMWPAEEIIKL